MDEFVAKEAIRRKTLGDARDVRTVAAEVKSELDTLIPPVVVGAKEVAAINIQRLKDGTERRITILGDGTETVEEARWR
jgi:autotransporter adhesin